MNEIINNPNQNDLIDIDLLIDYSKVIYSELTDLKHNKLNNQEFMETAKEVKQDIKATSKEESRVLPEPKNEETKSLNSESIEVEMPKPDAAPELEELGINFEGTKDFENVPKTGVTYEDLRKLIPLNDKFAYVIELFNGENNSYEDAINSLNLHTTYGNTMEWIIANLQNKYNWNVENDLVQNFYETIKKRFDT